MVCSRDATVAGGGGAFAGTGAAVGERRAAGDGLRPAGDGLGAGVALAVGVGLAGAGSGVSGGAARRTAAGAGTAGAASRGADPVWGNGSSPPNGSRPTATVPAAAHLSHALTVTP
jgi:hypothetical protein